MDSETFFACLSDRTRLRLLMLMQSEGERCVCDLVEALGDSQPKVSRHLATIRAAGLVRARRAGKWVHYSIEPDLPAWMREVLTATAAGTMEDRFFEADRARSRAQEERREPDYCD